MKLSTANFTVSTMLCELDLPNFDLVFLATDVHFNDTLLCGSGTVHHVVCMRLFLVDCLA